MKHFVESDVWVSQDAQKPCIMMILDAGHGGLKAGVYTTKGKQFDHGDFIFYEGVYNRDIAKQLSIKFKANNISHAFTTISNEDESLKDRVIRISNIVKSYPKYKFVLLSLHGNASDNLSANGIEFFTTEGVTESDYVANYYFPYFYDLGLKIRINRAKAQEYDKESNFYIIRKAEELGIPAILLEGGFFSNREEAIKMLDPEFQGTYTNALLKGTKDVIAKYQTNGSIH